MNPYDQAKQLRQIALPELAKRKSDLKRILSAGPSSADDQQLLISVLAFALGEISIWEGENQTGIRN